MEFSIFIPLMVAAIQSSGQVLSSFVSQAKQTASKYIFDKEFVTNAISDSTAQLADLLNATSADLRKEMREQSVRDAVEELQAHITSMGTLLSLVNAAEITPEMAYQLVTSGLQPLQVCLAKTEARLKRYKKDDLFLYCHIVGTNALIAGFVFAGQQVPSLQEDLKSSIYIFQKRLLDEIVQAKREIPWDQVPHLLAAEGITDLFELYKSSTQSTRKDSSISIVKKRKKKQIGTAKLIHDFLWINFSCSECGHGGLSGYAIRCPNCGRKFE